MKIKLRKSVLLIFLLGLIAACWYMDIPIKPLLTDMLVRLPMNGVFVLALLPMLNAGMGFNFGMPVGVIAGLLGISTIMNFGLKGMPGFLCVILMTVLLGWAFGEVYGRVLTKAKGRRFKRCFIILRAMLLGLFFNPKIEYIEE